MSNERIKDEALLFCLVFVVPRPCALKKQLVRICKREGETEHIDRSKEVKAHVNKIPTGLLLNSMRRRGGFEASRELMG